MEYFFLTPDEFRRRIANDEFLEYEEVYQDRFYGTLKEQVEKQLAAGQNVVFDVDVVGGCNIKKFYKSYDTKWGKARGCGKKWSWKINTGEAFVWIF